MSTTYVTVDDHGKSMPTNHAHQESPDVTGIDEASLNEMTRAHGMPRIQTTRSEWKTTDSRLELVGGAQNITPIANTFGLQCERRDVEIMDT